MLLDCESGSTVENFPLGCLNYISFYFTSAEYYEQNG